MNNLNRRDKIFNVIKVGYVAKKKKNLPIFGIKFKDLRDYTTNESDVGKGISRIPLQLARLYEEDVMEEVEVSTPTSGSSGASGDQASILDNYNKVMEHRQQAITNRNSMTASAGEKNPMLD
jgi:hypothetical protein